MEMQKESMRFIILMMLPQSSFFVSEIPNKGTKQELLRFLLLENQTWAANIGNASKNGSVVLKVLQQFNRSKAEDEENYDQLIKEACIEGLPIDTTAETYLKAARIADSQGLSIGNIIKGYQNSAEIFLSMDDSRALQCFLEAIQIYVKHGEIKLAIQNCFQYGYEIEKRPSLIQQSEELYTLGDKLRVQHTIFHSCSVRPFKKGYYKDVKRVAEDLFKKQGVTNSFIETLFSNSDWNQDTFIRKKRITMSNIAIKDAKYMQRTIAKSTSQISPHDVAELIQVSMCFAPTVYKINT
ncbi:hypothetical protein RF11_08158 [Thelohanellus kitauei]|uniref:Uncharacterized protein n=1 Tax=Thelohanellus kitauei TaxID=669202 RepID=A0A0C2J582_THEKT|nr:hypothetical protein RF11_08158 [Thelohanellus kitauei]